MPITEEPVLKTTWEMQVPVKRGHYTSSPYDFAIGN